MVAFELIEAVKLPDDVVETLIDADNVELEEALIHVENEAALL